MLFDQTTLLVKERIGFLKLADVYDILNPTTGQPIAIAMEKPGGFIKALRLLIHKSLLPTRIDVHENPDLPPVLTIRRGIKFLRPRVFVEDANGAGLGYFQGKLFSLGGAFDVFDPHDNLVAQVRGDWKGWNFKFTDAGGQILGEVTKKWSGAGKELFTSADNYMISLNAAGRSNAALLLAAALAVDIVYKEKS